MSTLSTKELTMQDNAVVVFTYKTIKKILQTGGTSSWSLLPGKARTYRYAVCTRNAKDKRGNEGTEEHQSAFLIGEIKAVVPASGKEDRYLLLFSRYAEIDKPKFWKGHRNPVKYLDSIKAAGIDVAKLDWKPMPDERDMAEEKSAASGLTIAQAKAGLALTFGVEPEDIEIVIRG